MAGKGTIRTVFYMDEADREALLRMSDESGLSPAELTRRAVKMFLRFKKRGNETFEISTSNGNASENLDR